VGGDKKTCRSKDSRILLDRNDTLKKHARKTESAALLGGCYECDEETPKTIVYTSECFEAQVLRSSSLTGLIQSFPGLLLSRMMRHGVAFLAGST